MRINRSSYIILLDAILITSAWFSAYWLRFNLTSIPKPYLNAAIGHLPIVITLQMACYLWFGLHRSAWRYSSMHDLANVIKVTMIGIGFIVLTLFVTNRIQYIPRSILPLYGLLLSTFLGAPRFFYRLIHDGLYLRQHLGQRILIVGAGKAGETLARELKRDKQSHYNPIAFVDDNEHRQGHFIHGIPVVANCDEIPTIVLKYAIELIFIAIPTANSTKMRRIVERCQESFIPYRTLPSLQDLANPHVSLSALRKVYIEDLLGRDTVQLDWQDISKEINDKVILISGGAGSIGSELARQIARLQPKKMIIADNSEFNLYQLRKELDNDYPQVEINFYLTDITDKASTHILLSNIKPHIILHAAAYKHVPLLQQQVHAALKNNLFATMNLAELAAEHNVQKFVFISTDKVVNPESVMGLSKRLAELYCQYISQEKSTQFITVRFGNVLGSAGSVVPLFQHQIDAGEAVTVTHPQATRYFMTIPEASQLILQSVVIGKSGEIYILDMGEPINIRYLAEQMIRLSGKQVGKDIDIRYTGLREGEKLHEELSYTNEQLSKTKHAKIMRAVITKKIDLEYISKTCCYLQQHYLEYPSNELLMEMKSLITENDESKHYDKTKQFI